MPPLIHASQLTKERSGRTIFSDLSFTVEAGSSLALTGPSGSGKTTLINCLGLLDRVDSGALEVAGVDTAGMPGAARRRLLRDCVGHLFQHYGLVESWSVSRNLDVAFIGKRLPRSERASRRGVALQRVGLGAIDDRRARRSGTYQLSGGEQQRLALARLLLKRPRIVIADEPTAALDVDNAAVVLSVLDELRASGCAVVIATHDEAVENWCDESVNLGDAGR